jgi:competence protein ComEC
VIVIATAAGLLVGTERLRSIDAGALRAPVGARATVSGYVLSPPRSDDGELRVAVETRSGRLSIEAPAGAELEVGEHVVARGILSEPDPWLAPLLRRHGIAIVLRASELRPVAGERTGLDGRIDAIRRRAERGLERGMPERESALARGFVLGQDDRIDPATRDDFRRSGLAHLLAVSGQNVILLCLLAWPLLALVGLTWRARVVALLVLIAVYVPVTGAGPSIQRAAVMGAAGLVAALASRPRSRWYAVLLAAAVTLALNPRTAGDVGWQLSFAAVLGIMLWGQRLAALLAGPADRGSPRRALADGAAATIAATLATAPLAAHHFGAVPFAALPANLLALPAVAPAMWLGMLTAIVAQVPALPVEPLNAINSLLLSYIAQVARWLASPDWSLLEVELEGIGSLAAAVASLAAAVSVGLRWAEGRRRMELAARPAGRSLSLGRGAIAAAVVVVVAALVWWWQGQGSSSEAVGDDALRVLALDVGQGDAILLDPPAGEPVLVDAGPADAGVAKRLRELGVETLAAAVVTHDQSDHAGGMAEVLESLSPHRLGFARAGPELRAAAAGSGVPVQRMAEGGELRSGDLRLAVLWPPPELAGASGEDPNRLSLVLLAEWHHFSLLLTGDAEAEEVPLDPGPVDVLKVAHHGSEDEGLARLLARTVPKLAVISVGEENPFGHPAPETISELESHGIRVLRTDQAGEVAIEANDEGWTAPAG